VRKQPGDMDEARNDADQLVRPVDRAIDDIVHVQKRADSPQVDVALAEQEGGLRRDHCQATELNQSRDDCVRLSVGKIFLRPVVGQVLEGQNRDG